MRVGRDCEQLGGEGDNVRHSDKISNNRVAIVAVAITERIFAAFAMRHYSGIVFVVSATSLKLLAYIALGSAAGGIARYLIGVTVQSRASVGFPVATLLINVTG